MFPIARVFAVAQIAKSKQKTWLGMLNTILHHYITLKMGIKHYTTTLYWGFMGIKHYITITGFEANSERNSQPAWFRWIHLGKHRPYLDHKVISNTLV